MNAATCTLPGELTIFTAAEVREALLSALADRSAADAPLRVDGSGVIDVDGAGVQLLVSLSRLCDRDERGWHLAEPSDALVGACRTLGLSMWLDAHRQSEGNTEDAR